MRENQQKKTAQNDENQVLPQLAAGKQQPSSSLSFVGISKRNRFWCKFWYLLARYNSVVDLTAMLRILKLKKAILPEINN